MLIYFVNEAIALIKLIRLVIAEVRLGMCTATEGLQTADGSTIDCLLAADTFLDDKTKIFSLKLSCCNNNDNKVQGYPFILNTQINN